MAESDRGHANNDCDHNTSRNEDGVGPRDYDDVVLSINGIIETFYHVEAMTYNPKSGKFYDVRDVLQAQALFNEIVVSEKRMNSNREIHLIAITCHASTKMDDDMRDAYAYASRHVNQPLIGTWTDENGEKYFDVVIPLQFSEAFKSDERALEIGRKYEQNVILRIDPDGTPYFLKTH